MGNGGRSDDGLHWKGEAAVLLCGKSKSRLSKRMDKGAFDWHMECVRGIFSPSWLVGSWKNCLAFGLLRQLIPLGLV